MISFVEIMFVETRQRANYKMVQLNISSQNDFSLLGA